MLSLAVGRWGTIYLLDAHNHGISIFDSSGKYQAGFSYASFSHPDAIAVDSAGNVYVADNVLGQVVAFSSNYKAVLWTEGDIRRTLTSEA